MVETEVLNLLKVSDDLFSCETPLGTTFEEFKRLSLINDDLFNYEVKIPKLTYAPYVEQQTDYLPKKVLGNYEWKMSYEEWEKIYAEVVILIDKIFVRLVDVTVEQWSYKKQIKDYLEIKKQRDTYKKEIDLEYNPSNMEFAEWVSLKFYNHKTMDWYTKNALWVYWSRGDDEVELNNEEVSNIEDKDRNGYKNNFINKWKKGTPWSKNDVPYEKVDHIWMVRVGYMTYFQDYKWYDTLIEGNLKEEALKQKAIYEGSWGNTTQGIEAILGVDTSPEDLNVKFLRSLPSEWDTHVVVWMNKPDFETMGLDDLYNNFKIVEQKVKRTVAVNNDDKNLAFLTTTSPSSTNSINTANTGVSTGNSKVNTASAETNDDLEENGDLKWNMALLSYEARSSIRETGRKISSKKQRQQKLEPRKLIKTSKDEDGLWKRQCVRIDGGVLIGVIWQRMKFKKKQKKKKPNGGFSPWHSRTSQRPKWEIKELQMYNCPNAYKHMVPRAVLMRTGLKTVKNAKPLSTARANYQLNEKGFVEVDAQGHRSRKLCSPLRYQRNLNGGFVLFGGGANGGRITGKGTIKTDKLDFEDVYFVKELKIDGLNPNTEDSQEEDQGLIWGIFTILLCNFLPNTTSYKNSQGHPIDPCEWKTSPDMHTFLFAHFLSQEEPKRVSKALSDPAWVEAMQEELLQFKLQNVWVLVDLPKGHRAIGDKVSQQNQGRMRGNLLLRNKQDFCCQGLTQEEGNDYMNICSSALC
ncbi:hypothetical protein Tco_0681388 [Tanacetum coccineum]|uniref:Uncharacterized protein n=1 Tax=Tanacetum coccineum TaxID=301880 RepID=A0ABQ4XNI4_9ASTR